MRRPDCLTARRIDLTEPQLDSSSGVGASAACHQPPHAAASRLAASGHVGRSSRRRRGARAGRSRRRGLGLGRFAARSHRGERQDDGLRKRRLRRAGRRIVCPSAAPAPRGLVDGGVSRRRPTSLGEAQVCAKDVGRRHAPAEQRDLGVAPSSAAPRGAERAVPPQRQAVAHLRIRREMESAEESCASTCWRAVSRAYCSAICSEQLGELPPARVRQRTLRTKAVQKVCVTRRMASCSLLYRARPSSPAAGWQRRQYYAPGRRTSSLMSTKLRTSVLHVLWRTIRRAPSRFLGRIILWSWSRSPLPPKLPFRASPAARGLGLMGRRKALQNMTMADDVATDESQATSPSASR